MPQRGAPPRQQASAQGFEDLGGVLVGQGQRGAPPPTRARAAAPTSPADSGGFEDLGGTLVAAPPERGLLEPRPYETEFNPAGYGVNWLKSIGRLGETAAELAGSPIQAIKGVNELGWGIAEKAVPGVRQRVTGQLGPLESNPVDAVLQSLQERFGGMEALKKTAYEDPAGLFADIAGIMSGTGGALKAGGKLAGATRVTKAGEAIAEKARLADPLNLIGKGVKKLGSPISGGVGHLASEGIGITTGAGGEAIRTAYRSPSFDFKAALRGEVSIGDIVDQTKAAVQKLRTKRSTEYQAAKSTLPPMALDLRPAQGQLTQELSNFGVTVHPVRDPITGAVRMVPDFSISSLKGESANAIESLLDDVYSWPTKHGVTPDQIPSDAMQRLKERIDTTFPKDAKAQKIFSTTRKAVRESQSVIPGYDEMAAEYKKATGFISEVESELSAARNAKKGAAVRKLQYALNQNNDYRRVLTEALDETAHTRLKDQVAGFALSQLAPRGLARSLTGLNILWGVGHGFNPIQWLQFALASPRVVGELVSGLSEAGTMGKPIRKAVTAPALRRAGAGALPAAPPAEEPKPPPK